MIVFELICPDHHRFEGWFASPEDFDSQKSRGLLSCPNCGSAGIEKLLTAKIGKSEVVPAAPRRQQVTNLTPAQLHKLIDHVLQNTEDVGGQFADEARRIHREEVPQRAIRGVASPDETKELLEEGVPVFPLPIPGRGDWH